jgi:hypothetical protein
MTDEMPKTIYVARNKDQNVPCDFVADSAKLFTHENIEYTNTEALIAELEGMKKPIAAEYDISIMYNAAIDAVIEKLKQLEKGDGFGTGTATGSGYASGSGYGSGGY